MLGGELERAFSKFIFKVDVGSVTDKNFGAVGVAALHCPVEGSHSKLQQGKTQVLSDYGTVYYLHFYLSTKVKFLMGSGNLHGRVSTIITCVIIKMT